jgi:hypothetical protein
MIYIAAWIADEGDNFIGPYRTRRHAEADAARVEKETGYNTRIVKAVPFSKWIKQLGER